MEKTLTGKIICPGFAVGKANVLFRDVRIPRQRIASLRVPEELERYARALAMVRSLMSMRI